MLQRLAVSALVCFLSAFAHAQTSQFLFDPNGNLTVQMAETILPPQIIGQPQNQVLATNESAAFSVIVADPRSLTYQWRFNNANLNGATNASLLLENVSTNNEGEYSVVLTNPSGSVTSAPARLMIDNDADGVPDFWEQTYFTDLNQNATSDFDGDGISNVSEFFDDTNPTNKLSARFRLTVLMDGDGAVELDPNQTSYTNGQTVTLTAIPFGTNLFYAWTGSAGRTNANPLVLTMTTNKTVRAHFNFLPLDIVWTNSAGGDWHSPSNWNPNVVPTAIDNAILPITATITVSGPAECLGLMLGGVSGNPVLTGNGTLTVHGASTWAAGMSGSGRTILESNATMNVSGVVGLSTRTLENRGAIFVFNNGTFSVTGGAVFTNCAGGLVHIVNHEASIGGGFASGRFDNAGTFRKSSGIGIATINSGLTFNNFGTVEIQTGTLLCSSTFTNNGTVDVSAGATIRLSAGGSATGAFTAQPGALVEWSGGSFASFALNSGAQLNGSGLYRINAATVAVNGNVSVETLNLISGTLEGTGTLTLVGAMNWMGGAMTGSGRTIVSAGAMLDIAPPSSVSLNARTLDNGGVVHWTGAGILAVTGGGVITNRASALFHVLNAAGLGGASAAGRFDNAGTFRKSAHSGNTTVASGLSFNNPGTVEIETGTLSLGGGGFHSGSFIVPFGTALFLSGGTHNAVAGSSIAGEGQFTVAGGTANLAGLVNLSGSNTFSGGVANLTGNYICAKNTLAVSGGTVNFNGTGAVSPAMLNLSNGTLAGSNTVTVNMTMNWTGGTMSGNGRTIIALGATLNAVIPSFASLTTRTLENGGTATVAGPGILGVTGGAVVTNLAGALLQVDNESAGGIGGASAGGRIDNAGTIRKANGTGTTLVASGLTLNNSGAIEIQTGTLRCSGTFTNNGAVTLAAGTTNRLAAGSASGVFTAPATAMVEWTAGTFTLNAGVQLNGAGLYRINGGTLTDNANSAVNNLDLTGGTLNGSGAVTINSVMNWTAGTMSGSGRTIIPFGATCNIANPGSISLRRVLDNNGTVLWSGAGIWGLLNGVITNHAAGLFQVQNAAAFALSGGACRIDNVGTFRKSNNPGPTTIPGGVPFNNSGTVDIRSGILAANGGYTSSSSALLNCALGGTTVGTGHGQLQVAGAVTLGGSLSVNFTNGFTPTTNDAFTVVTAGARNGGFADFLYPSNTVTMQLSNTANSVIVHVSAVAGPELVLFPPVLTSSNVTLCWVADSNKTYQLEYTFDPGMTNWDVVPGEVTASSNRACQIEALTSTNRFYRVRVLP